METKGDAEADWTLEVGQGEGAFAPLEEGAHVTRVHGPQGGEHVYVAARLQGPHLRAALEKYAYVEVEVTTATALVSRSVSMIGASSMEETTSDFASLYAYVDDDVHGDVTISIKVASEDKSKWASASRHVVLD